MYQYLGLAFVRICFHSNLILPAIFESLRSRSLVHQDSEEGRARNLVLPPDHRESQLNSRFSDLTHTVDFWDHPENAQIVDKNTVWFD